MALPVGVTKKTKNNGKKNYRAHDEWMEGKKLGRRKQRWVPDIPGHWEKV